MVGILCASWFVAQEASADTPAVVVEPFLELHTGPGRGYPVFYIAEKGELISLVKQRTDWFQVRLPNGQVGWAQRLEVEKTLRASGHRKRLTEKLYDDWISKRLSLGWAAGTFAGDPALFVRAMYDMTDHLGLEGNIASSSGDLGSTDLYYLGLVVTPWGNPWFSISGTLGAGWVHVDPESLLVDASSDVFPEAHAGIGFKLHLFRDLFVRGDFRNYSLFMDSNRTREFQGYSLGVSFQF